MCGRSLRRFRTPRGWVSSILFTSEINRIPESSTIEENALSVLHGMLISIPTFWGSEELTQVIRLYTDHYFSKDTRPAVSTSLMNTIAKRVPPKVLLPTLCDMWSSIEASPRVVTLILLVPTLELTANSIIRTETVSSRTLTYWRSRYAPHLGQWCWKIYVLYSKPSSRHLVCLRKLQGLMSLRYRNSIVALMSTNWLSFLDWGPFDTSIHRTRREAKWSSIPTPFQETLWLGFRRWQWWVHILRHMQSSLINSRQFPPDTSDARKTSFCHIYSSLLDFFKVSSNMLSFRSDV